MQLPDLLNLLFAMIQNAGEGQLKTMLYQNYASIINKTERFDEIANNFHDHLEVLGSDILFLLWNLKAAMLACCDLAYERIIPIIIDQSNLSTDLGSALVANIEVHKWLHGLFIDFIKILCESSELQQHFVSEAKLFPRQNVLYGQQSFHLICQPFRHLATDAGSTVIARGNYIL